VEIPNSQWFFAYPGIARNAKDLRAMKLWIRRSVVRVHPAVPDKTVP
jgi:hypothetical protein